MRREQNSAQCDIALREEETYTERRISEDFVSTEEVAAGLWRRGAGHDGEIQTT